MSNLPTYNMFIGGEWVPASSGEWFETFDPYAGQPWALVAKGSKADADSAVARRVVASPRRFDRA